MTFIVEPTTEHQRLVARIKDVIARRRGSAYGTLAITDEQVDELSRAISQRVIIAYQMTETEED